MFSRKEIKKIHLNISEESTGGSDVMVSNGEKTDEQTKSNGDSATSSERVSVDQETHSETSGEFLFHFQSRLSSEN